VCTVKWYHFNDYFRKLKENRKSDDDDAVHKLCSQSSQNANCETNTVYTSTNLNDMSCAK